MCCFLLSPIKTWKALFFIRYDFFKTTLLSNPVPFIDHQFRDNLSLHLVSSCLSGMFATSKFILRFFAKIYIENLLPPAVCSPADVLRSRLMASVCRPNPSRTTWLFNLVQSGDSSFVHILTKSFREEGIRFLFKGWTPSFIRLGPNTVCMFVFYEVLSLTLAIMIY